MPLSGGNCGDSKLGVNPPSAHLPSDPEDHPRSFATTHWSVVLAASQPQMPGHQAALEQLCRTYWYPLYAYIRRRGFTAADAEDLTQEFFARLLAKEWLAGIEADGRRFRSFLLTVVTRFLANEWDRGAAAKRGHGIAPLNLDEAEGRFLTDAHAVETAEHAYDRHWAITVMDAAWKRVRDEARDGARAGVFEHLSPLLSREPAPGEYEALGRSLHLSPGAVGVAVYRLRRRYREVVRTLIAETVAEPGEVDGELQHLVDVLRHGIV